MRTRKGASPFIMVASIIGGGAIVVLSGAEQGTIANPGTAIGVIVALVGVTAGGFVFDGTVTRREEEKSSGSGVSTEVEEEIKDLSIKTEQVEEKVDQQTNTAAQAEAETAPDGGTVVKEEEEVHEMSVQVEEEAQQILETLVEVDKLFSLMREIGQANDVRDLPGKVMGLVEGEQVEQADVSKAKQVIEANIEDSDKSKDEFYEALDVSAKDLEKIEDLEQDVAQIIEQQIETIEDEEIRIDKNMFGKRKGDVENIKEKLENTKEKQISELKSVEQDLEVIMEHTDELRTLVSRLSNSS